MEASEEDFERNGYAKISGETNDSRFNSESAPGCRQRKVLLNQIVGGRRHPLPNS
jgi:hypothetical protein